MSAEPRQETSFMDISTEILMGFVYKRTTVFGFPSFPSSIPSKMKYELLCSQSWRFASRCHFKEDIVHSCQIFKLKEG